MMKILLGLLLLSASCYAGKNTCSVDSVNFSEWIDLEKAECYIDAISQTRMEIDASYTYLYIGAHFAQDVINRPGIADFFFKAAKEEREHATKLIEYLSMRGHLNNVEELIKKDSILEKDDNSRSLKIKGRSLNDALEIKLDSKSSAADAFIYALKLEEKVTKSIRALIKSCETNKNYYHIVDWLTGVYLEEQLHGKRELAGKWSQLIKMGPGALGEFLFDKTL
ncbi:ferritin subunit-like [Teleopsis dalmanni]|uniref:ferritin subunit-like n=1 Tax=Teleopsis dalmanni TaxID=139649 RepID=UPI0018CF3320|nr:ferritin subunit-like [Teleopsis dalmanni]